jgi:transaldolase
VTTLPKATLEAFEDHGQVAATVDRDVEEAALTLGDLGAIDVDLELLTDKLERDGIVQFARSVDAVVERIRASSPSTLAA